MANPYWKDRRIEIHKMFQELLGPGNEKHVYYNPPEGIKMEYPAIRYMRDGIPSRAADDMVYKTNHTYICTLITREAESHLVDAMAQIPRIRYSRHYKADNLNHDIFTIY